MTIRLSLLTLLILVVAPISARADTIVRATLLGHAVLPAETSVAPPPDAERLNRDAGRFVQSPPLRGTATTKINGVSLPLRNAQPVQGISALRLLEDGTFLALSDNGFGSTANSADALLMWHRLAADWETGTVTVLESTVLSDPLLRAPFRLINEASESRYLTGADFDPESLAIAGDRIFVGDERGPYLLEFDRRGRLRRVRDVLMGDLMLRGPDHPDVESPASPGDRLRGVHVARSSGIEAMDVTPDGNRLVLMLEAPLVDPDSGTAMRHLGRAYVPVISLKTTNLSPMGPPQMFPLENPELRIGGLAMVDETTMLVLERDGTQGDPKQACTAKPRPCFAEPAQYKRLVRAGLTRLDDDGMIRRAGAVDLMAIQDPQRNARQGGGDDVFAFPFVTIESIAVTGRGEAVIANDNNFPFSTGRKPETPDDTEVIRLDIRPLFAVR